MFSLLNVRSVDDLTAAARIRDAAIERFGEQGFGVGLRTIADNQLPVSTCSAFPSESRAVTVPRASLPRI